MESAPIEDVRPLAAPTLANALPAVAGTAVALPVHRYGQRELAQVARQVLPGEVAEPAVIERFFRRVGVEERHLALPAEAYASLSGLGARNDAWLETAVTLAHKALEDA